MEQTTKKMCKNHPGKEAIIAFDENYFLKMSEWSSRESFQGTGILIVAGSIHHP